MLWQKEMIDGEMLYAKLLTESEEKTLLKDFSERLQQSKLVKQRILKKNNSVSEIYRKRGNEFFTSGHYGEALRWYNESLTLVENNSEELGICYANRAACFLILKKYKSCLVDIELAKKNKYPARLMPKLDRRKMECEKLFAAHGDTGSQRAEAKLSFDPSRKIPCFADGLEVKYSGKYGNHIVTNRDLEIGQTIIVERAFVFDSPYGASFCANCFKWAPNLIPCGKCVLALYCSEECRTAAMQTFHYAFCDIDIIYKEAKWQLVMKSIITVINTYGTIDALMDAIEIFIAKSSTEINFVDPAKRAYFQFFTLRTQTENFSPQFQNDLKHAAVEIVEVLIHVSGAREIFRSKRIVQFLSHLVLHHLHIISLHFCEASHGISYRYNDVIGIEESTKITVCGLGIVSYSNQINHSCVPNVCRIFIGDTVVYKVLRPIKSGEQLFVSYLNFHSLLKPVQSRTSEIATWLIRCECISCASNCPPFKESGKQTLDVLSCRLLSILDDVPHKDVTNLMPVTRHELQMFEKAAVNYSQMNDHLHPTMESAKMQFLLTQIWHLLMR